MRTTLTLLVLALTASSVMSACAGDNALATLFGLTGLVDAGAGGTPVTVTAAMSVCGFAVGDTAICCTETQVATTIQTYITNLKTTLEGFAGDRDEYIIEQRGDVIDVLSSLRKLNELADSNSDDVPSAYESIATLFAGYASTIADNFTAIVENFDNYQTERATCMDVLLKSQATLACASCLATDPTGITSATPAVSLDDTLVTQIRSACYNYIDYSERQSTIISTSIFSAGLANLASGLEKAVNGDLTGAAEDITSAYTTLAKASYSSTNAQKAVTIPDSCTSSSCSWIESTLFGTNGILSNDAAIVGGTVVTAPTFSVSRVLSEGNERRLASNGYVKDLTTITFTTGFSSNPGSVDNTKNANSALRNGIVACVVAALALVF